MQELNDRLVANDHKFQLRPSIDSRNRSLLTLLFTNDRYCDDSVACVYYTHRTRAANLCART